MNRIEQIERKLKDHLEAHEIEIVDDSWRHAGHAGVQNLGEAEATHLTISVASKQFEGLSTLDQHRKVHKVLKEEMDTFLHALVLKTKDN